MLLLTLLVILIFLVYRENKNKCSSKDKHILMQIYYKLNDYDISLNKSNCDNNIKPSSHIFIEINLNEKINKPKKPVI